MMYTDLTSFCAHQSAFGGRPRMIAHTLQRQKKCFVATFKCYPLLYCESCMVWGSPVFQSTSDSSGAEKVRGQIFCHKHQTNRLGTRWVTYPRGHDGASVGVGFVLCLVIVSVSPTTSRRQQRGDKQIERPFDATASVSMWYANTNAVSQPGG